MKSMRMMISDSTAEICSGEFNRMLFVKTAAPLVKRLEMARDNGWLCEEAVYSPKQAGRPKGSAVRFPGIKAFAAEQGVTPLHVYMVLTGQRHSRRVTTAWTKRNAV